MHSCKEDFRLYVWKYFFNIKTKNKEKRKHYDLNIFLSPRDWFYVNNLAGCTEWKKPLSSSGKGRLSTYWEARFLSVPIFVRLWKFGTRNSQVTNYSSFYFLYAVCLEENAQEKLRSTHLRLTACWKLYERLFMLFSTKVFGKISRSQGKWRKRKFSS